MKKAATVVLFASLVSVAGAQETLYVSERLFLGLYAEPDNGGERLMLIPSGDAVTVLERLDGDARVRTADGTEGWVRFNVLTAEIPARNRIARLQARLTELEADAARIPGLEAAAARIPGLEAAAARATELEDKLATAREAAGAPDPDTLAALETAERRASELAAQLAEAHVAVDEAGNIGFRELWGAYWAWLVGAVVVASSAGFIAGWLLLDRRVRRQHGGYRTW